MSRSKEMDLTTGNPFWSLLKFAIPVILGNLFQLFYTLADSVIVGKRWEQSPLQQLVPPALLSTLCSVLSMDLPVDLVSAWGSVVVQRMKKECEKALLFHSFLSIGFTVVLTLVCCSLMHQILSWMQIPEDISGEAYDYMFVVLLGTGRNCFLQHDLQHAERLWRQ